MATASERQTDPFLAKCVIFDLDGAWMFGRVIEESRQWCWTVPPPPLLSHRLLCRPPRPRFNPTATCAGTILDTESLVLEVVRCVLESHGKQLTAEVAMQALGMRPVEAWEAVARTLGIDKGGEELYQQSEPLLQGRWVGWWEGQLQLQFGRVRSSTVQAAALLGAATLVLAILTLVCCPLPPPPPPPPLAAGTRRRCCRVWRA